MLLYTKRELIMKKSLLLSVGIALFLTACSEPHDKTYYLDHIDEAKSRMAQCKDEMEEAFKNNDKEAFEKLGDKQSECSQADAAIREDRQRQREKERAEKEAQAKIELDKAMQQMESEYGKQTWQEFAHTYVNDKTCQGFFLADDNYQCRAFKALYEKKAQAGIDELKKQELSTLLGEEQTYCKTDKRRYSACDIWKRAANEKAKTDFEKLSFEDLAKLKEAYNNYQSPINSAYSEIYRKKEKTVIDDFAGNYENLKKVYNQCVDAYQGTKDWKVRSQISDTYPCEQARSARSKLQLPYDNFKKKMD